MCGWFQSDTLFGKTKGVGVMNVVPWELQGQNP